jgi:hypothetical protein
MQTWDEHVENHERFLRDCLNKKAEVIDEACDRSLDEGYENQMDIDLVARPLVDPPFVLLT